MSLDLSSEELLSDEEILSILPISQQDLNSLEDRGLLFIRIGESHFYLTSTLLTFLKGIEGKAGKKGRSRKHIEGDSSPEEKGMDTP